MTDESEESRSDLLGQLQDVLGRIGGIAGQVPGVSAVLSHAPELPHVPWPAALSAAEVDAVLAGITAQRRHLEAVRASLDAFEQQLEVLARLLDPLQSITRQLAAIENRVSGGPSRPAGAEPTE